jgi:tetratricopeptide (TPR) repeat protein
MTPFTLTVEATAMDVAQRTGDWPRLHQDCLPWGTGVQASQPALSLRLLQACAAEAIHSGELARAQALLDQGEQVVQQFFAKVPGRHAVLWLRQGELALAKGQREAAIALWRRVMSIDDLSVIASQAQAFAHLRALDALDKASEARALSLVSRLQNAGGERYYAEYLGLLRQAVEVQTTPN